mmetsp:Transcript_19659/g.25913  ORF Transcript_19659/g.25913 Transcript_19659/m.25913 type:complete len:85 (+) Transcript_19659:102-356(+)
MYIIKKCTKMLFDHIYYAFQESSRSCMLQRRVHWKADSDKGSAIISHLCTSTNTTQCIAHIGSPVVLGDLARSGLGKMKESWLL